MATIPKDPQDQSLVAGVYKPMLLRLIFGSNRTLTTLDIHNASRNCNVAPQNTDSQVILRVSLMIPEG